jgi:hypothetical protein
VRYVDEEKLAIDKLSSSDEEGFRFSLPNNAQQRRAPPLTKQHHQRPPGICFHEYDVALPSDAKGPDRRPCLSRTCCHTLCFDCAQGMVGTEQGREGNCPFCRQPQAFPHGRSYSRSSGRKVVNHLTMRLLLLHSAHPNQEMRAEAAVAAAAPTKKDASTQVGKGFKLKPPPPCSPALASGTAAPTTTSVSSPPPSVAATSSTTTSCATPPGPTVTTTATVVSPDESVSASASTAAPSSSAADSFTFRMGVPSEIRKSKSSRKKNRPFSWRDMQKSGRWAARAPPITSPLTDAGLGRTARLHLAMVGRVRLEDRFQPPLAPSPTITKDPAHPTNVPENANRLFELISGRKWVDAHQRAQRHPDEATRRFVSKGRYTTLVHAALYFGAPYALMQLLAEIDPAALYVRSWFMDKNEKLLPVDWAKQLFRLDVIPLLEPPELSLAAALSAITVSDPGTQALPAVAAAPSNNSHSIPEAGTQPSPTEDGSFANKNVGRSSSTAAEPVAAATATNVSRATTSGESAEAKPPAQEELATASPSNAAEGSSPGNKASESGGEAQPRSAGSKRSSSGPSTILEASSAKDERPAPGISTARDAPIAGKSASSTQDNGCDSSSSAVAVAAASDPLVAPSTES